MECLTFDKSTLNFNKLSIFLINRLEAEIKDQMVFNSFFRDLKVVDYIDGVFIIKVLDLECEKILNKDYKNIVIKIINEHIKKEVCKNVRFISKENDYVGNFDNIVLKTSKNLNPNLTFDNYVVSSYNESVVEAIFHTLETPGDISPLFITSPTGLGKTHLLHALGNKLNSLNKSCFYITPNIFTNDLFKISKKNKNFSEYIESFNEYDYILFDDIQLIGGRESSLKVLFNIINNFDVKNKQMIFTSDKSPNQLSGFEQRFISRFEGGMTASMKQLDFKDLNKIFSFFLKNIGLSIEQIEKDSLSFVFSNFSSSVRSLKNAINKIKIYKKNYKNLSTINKTLLSKIFGDEIVDEKDIKINKIIEVVCNEYKIKISQIKSKSKKQEICLPRYLAMYLIKEMKKISLQKIAKEFDKKDHTTVLSGLKIITKKINEDRNFFSFINRLKEKIKKFN